MSELTKGGIFVGLVKSIILAALLIGIIELTMQPTGLSVFYTEIFALTLIFWLFWFDVGSVSAVFNISNHADFNWTTGYIVLIPTLLCNGLALTFFLFDIQASNVSLSKEQFFQLLISAVFIMPLLEELIFRQITPQILHAHFKIKHWLVVAICSALFAVSHLSFDILWFSYFFVMGLSFHYVRDSSGSLILAFLSHAILNLSIIILDMIFFS
ncbi:CPBP family intramembrane glutamic endopeptidase [Alkalimonas amylolytica]|uniref:CAAX protease self-immunity n=1 Tax=Alkalimonas amylolytica TaxID=152573 RepID=A0A1H4B6A0_ALKAM|nr:type II CAAX endopeptidase family protein [Alkalimonas amylolytica]SEA43650.1 CAAX protease self-immunity [Alkalimonas amylolytica]